MRDSRRVDTSANYSKPERVAERPWLGQFSEGLASRESRIGLKC